MRDRFGGTVTAVSMGPPKAADVLRSCLFRGADRAILLTDRRAAASDTLATSYILAQVIKTDRRLRSGLCRSPGDRRRHGSGRTSVCRKAGSSRRLPTWKSWWTLKDGVRANSPQHRQRLGDRRSQLPVLVTVMDTANMPRPEAARRVHRFKRAKRGSRGGSEGESRPARRLG